MKSVRSYLLKIGIKLYSNLSSLGRKYYVLVFLIIPLSLLVVFFLPVNIKEFLALYIKNATVWSLLTSNYVHFTLDHLSSNLIWYFIFMLSIILLESDRKRFLFMLFVTLIIAPISASIWWILLRTGTQSNELNVGFSTSVYCLSGYGLYLTVEFFTELFSGKSKGYLEYLLFLVVFVPCMISFLYGDIISCGRIINVPAHYLGFILRGLLPFLWTVFKEAFCSNT